jgi:hypothetical protein
MADKTKQEIDLEKLKENQKQLVTWLENQRRTSQSHIGFSAFDSVITFINNDYKDLRQEVC